MTSNIEHSQYKIQGSAFNIQIRDAKYNHYKLHKKEVNAAWLNSCDANNLRDR